MLYMIALQKHGSSNPLGNTDNEMDYIVTWKKKSRGSLHSKHETLQQNTIKSDFYTRIEYKIYSMASWFRGYLKDL